MAQTPIDPAVLSDFVATVDAKPNLTFKELRQKFPEFKDDAMLQSASDYYATLKSGKYKSVEEVNGKFPEFFTDAVQKKSPDPSVSSPSADSENPYRLPGELSPIAGSEAQIPLKGEDGAVEGFSVGKVAPLGVSTVYKPTLSVNPLDRDRIIENGKVDQFLQAQRAGRESSKDNGVNTAGNFAGAVTQAIYGLPADILDAAAIGDAATGRALKSAGVGGTINQSKDTWEAKAADWYRNAIAELAPTNPSMRNELSTTVASSLGNLVTLAMTGGATAPGKIGLQVGKAATGLTGTLASFGKELASPVSAVGGLQMGVGAYKDAKANGASDEVAFNSFLKQGLVGAVLEQIPIKLFYKRLDDVSGGGVKQLLKKGFAGGSEEMATEVMQQVYGNLDASQTYDKTRKILDGVGESGGIGFGLGFLLNAMGVSLRQKRQQATTPEQIASVDQASELLNKEIIKLHPEAAGFQNNPTIPGNETTNQPAPEPGPVLGADEQSTGSGAGGQPASAPAPVSAPTPDLATGTQQAVNANGVAAPGATEGVNSPATTAEEAIAATLPPKSVESAKHNTIADALTRFPKDSFARFGDVSNLKGQMQIQANYFSKEGLPLDVQAQQMSYALNPSGDGTEISPEDIVQFVNQYPGGKGQYKNRVLIENGGLVTGKSGRMNKVVPARQQKSYDENVQQIFSDHPELSARDLLDVMNTTGQGASQVFSMADIFGDLHFDEIAKLEELLKQRANESPTGDSPTIRPTEGQTPLVSGVAATQATGAGIGSSRAGEAPTKAVNEQPTQAIAPEQTGRTGAETSNSVVAQPSERIAGADGTSLTGGGTNQRGSATPSGGQTTGEADAATRIAQLQSRRTAAWERIKQKSTNKAYSGIDPSIIPDLVEVGLTYIEEGAVRGLTSIKKFKAQLKEEYKGITGQDLSDEDAETVYDETVKQHNERGLSDSSNAGTDSGNRPVDDSAGTTKVSDRPTDSEKPAEGTGPTRERGVSVQLRTKLNIPTDLAARATADPMLYEQLGNKEAMDAAADDLKKRLSTESSTNELIGSLSSTGTEDLTRRNLQSMMLSRMFNELASETSDPQLKQQYLSTAFAIIDATAERATLAGQGTQVMALLDQNTPEGLQFSFQKAVGKWMNGERKTQKGKAITKKPAQVVKAESVAKQLVIAGTQATQAAAKEVGQQVEKAQKQKTSPQQRVEEVIKKRLSTNTTKARDLLGKLFSRANNTLTSGGVNPEVAQQLSDTVKEIIKDLIRLGRIKVGAKTSEVYASVASELGLSPEQTAELQSFAEKAQLYENASDQIAVERLSSRIYRDTKADNSKASSPIDRMVNELYKSANEVYKKKKVGKAPPARALDLIKESFANKGQYQQIYEQAQEKVQQQLSDELSSGKITQEQHDSALAQLDDYFFLPFFKGAAQKTVQKALTAEMKAQNVSVSSLVSDFYGDRSKSQSLKEALINQAGLSEAEADVLGRQIESAVEEKAQKATASKVKSLLKGTKKVEGVDPTQLADRVAELSRLGVLSEQGIMDLDGFSERFGIPRMTPAVAEGISSRAKKMQDLPAGQLRDEAREELVKFMASQFPPRKSDVFWSLYYPALLSGVSTHLQNVLANAGNVISENISSTLRNPLEQVDRLIVYLDAAKQGRTINESLVQAARTLKLGSLGSKYGDTLARDAKKLTNRRGIEDLANSYPNNKYVQALKYVPRALEAEDALFTANFKAGELFGLVRDKYINQGLRGSQLRQAVMDEVYPSKQTVGQAQLQAKRELFGDENHTPSTFKEESDLKVRTVEVLRKSVAPEIVAKALSYGQKMTYKGRATGVGGVLARSFAQATDNPVVAALVKLGIGIDFVNIGFNIANQALNYTPVYGHLRAYNLGVSNIPAITEWLEKRGLEPSGNYESDSRERSQQIARANLATAAAVTALALAMRGYDDEEYEKNVFDVTGPSSLDFNQANADKRLRPPASFRVKGVWVNYTLIPGLNFAFALAGASKDYLRHHGKMDKEGKLLNQKDLEYRYSLAMLEGSMSAVRSSLIDATPMKAWFSNFQQQKSAKEPEDFQDFTDQMTKDYLKPALTRAASSVSQPAVPNFLRQIERVYDPTVYSPKTVRGMALKSLGLLNLTSEDTKEQEAVFDAFGRKVKFYPGEMNLPFQHWAGELGNDPVDKYIYGTLGMVPRQASGNSLVYTVDSKGEEQKHAISEDKVLYRRYVIESGKAAYREIEAFRKEKHPDWTVADKKEEVKQLIADARADVLDRIQDEIDKRKVKFSGK